MNLLLLKVLMKPTQQKVFIEKFKSGLCQLYQDFLSEIILYGSYARGDYDSESDIDFLVVLDKQEIDYGEEIGKMTKFIYPLMLDYDIIVSYLPIPKKRWQEEKSFFFDNVKKDGLSIWMKELNES